MVAVTEVIATAIATATADRAVVTEVTATAINSTNANKLSLLNCWVLRDELDRTMHGFYDKGETLTTRGDIT